MTLRPGSRLGPYEVLAPLGAGGMGEVYRAKDPRLGRDVAIKVLPASFSNDAGRLRRFEQEARAAGLLNHPNITIVYDIGSSSNGAPYVVQELLDGETLRMELASGRFSPRKAIDYAMQIAHGLAAAHDKGIVHRDLKPENLFVTKEGRVKILDFGLAKLMEPDGAGSSATNLPTETPQGTEPGVVMGTLGYMSPEQVKGKPADARSDIFAFGTVLYEMLSGKRAFQADSAAETISAILREDPPDLSVTNKSVSPGLERIVRHCIEKNPERRFQSASDIGFDLEALSGSSGSVTATAGPAPRFRRLVWPAIALLVGLLTGTFLLSRPHVQKPPTSQQLTFRRGQIFNARFAPDGQTVVFWASWDGGPGRIYSLRPGSPEWSPLNLPDLGLLSISRSGELAVQVLPVEGHPSSRDRALARVPMSGGSPRDILNEVRDADWAPDEASLAVAHTVNGKARLEFPIGKILYESSSRVDSLRVSPGGDQVAFVDHPIQNESLGSVMVVDRTGLSRPLSKGWMDVGSLVWSPDAKEIWFSASRISGRRSLWAVTLSGRLRLLADSPGSSWILDVSPTGKVLLNQASWRASITGVPAGETTERDFTWLDFSSPTDLSEDGKTLLFQEWGEGGGAKGSVYLRRMDGSPPVRLGDGLALALSPDEKWVLARLYTKPPRLVLLPTGAGEPKPLPVDGVLVHQAAWFPDGKRILLLGSAPGRELSLYTLDGGGGKPRLVTPAADNSPIRPTLISPDGRLVARIGKDNRVALLPLEGGEPRPAAGVEPGETPIRWSPDGRFLFVGKRQGTRATVSRVDPFSGEREAWRQFSISADAAGLVYSADSFTILLSADGKACFWGYQQFSDELYLVEGLK